MTEATLVCANHPQRETTLRCNRCEKPICGECAVRTPVGYRCKECVRGQQAVFETATGVDYPLVFIVAALGVWTGVSLLGSLWLWGILLAPIVGGVMAEVIRRVLRGHRSRYFPRVVILGGVVGIIGGIYPVLSTLFLMLSAGVGVGEIVSIAAGGLWPVVYGGLIISACYYRMGGIRL
jgi:hypothetical protein